MQPYDSWSVEALRAYVIMIGEFMSGSMQEDPLRNAYAEKLAHVSDVLAARERETTTTKVVVAFPSETPGRVDNDNDAPS